jgi:MFS family permease
MMLLMMPSYTVSPLLQALITKEYDVHSQGELLGVLAGLKTLSAFIGPLIANNMFAYFISENAPVKIPGISFYVAAVLYGIALVIMLIAYRQYPEKTPEVVGERDALIDSNSGTEMTP